jgi:hypothetical protein
LPAKRAKPAITLARIEQPMVPAALAQFLGGSKASIDAAAIERDIRQGAPADAKGRISLAAYTAWLCRRLDPLKHSS